MKKILMVAMVLGLLVSEKASFAQKVAYKDIYLGMPWTNYINKMLTGKNLSLEDLNKDCKDNADSLTNYYKDRLSKDEFESYWKSKFDECLNARIGYPDCDFGRINILFVNEKIAKIKIEITESTESRIDSVIEAIHEKWGKPHKKQINTYQNAYGAKVDGWIEIWVIGGNVISLTKIPININNIYYTYTLKTKQQADKEAESLPKKPAL